MSALEPALAVAAGVLSGSCAIPYVRDIRRGTTRPHRVSWAIFAVLATTAAASQLSNGWSCGALLSAGAALAFLTVFALSLRHGVGGASVADRLTLAGSVAILALWAWTGDALVAVLLVIGLEVTATALTMHKAWHDPGSETMSSWMIDGAAGALALVGSTRPDVATLAYPLYHFVSNNAMVAVLAVRARASRPVIAPAPEPIVGGTQARAIATWAPPLPPPTPR